MLSRAFTTEEAKKIGDQIGADWNTINLEEFRVGLIVELEHELNGKETDVKNDDFSDIGKVALARLKETPDYYSRLRKMEDEYELGIG
jgi:hypothetical protein